MHCLPQVLLTDCVKPGAITSSSEATWHLHPVLGRKGKCSQSAVRRIQLLEPSWFLEAVPAKWIVQHHLGSEIRCSLSPTAALSECRWAHPRCFLLWWRWFLSFLCFFLSGVGGNLVAIQASRISTFLHFWSMPGVLPYKMRQNWPNPCTTFFSSGTPWTLGVHVSRLSWQAAPFPGWWRTRWVPKAELSPSTENTQIREEASLQWAVRKKGLWHVCSPACKESGLQGALKKVIEKES